MKAANRLAAAKHNNGSEPGNILADQLTELERVKMENYALKPNSLQQQLQGNLIERAAFIRQIEAAHPGYQWDEQGGLVGKNVNSDPMM